MRRTPGGSEALRVRLDRHQRARESGIPTLSVLVGDGRLARDAWETWLRQRACSSVWLALEDDSDQPMRRIGHALLQGCSALRNVAAFAAKQTGEALVDVETRLESLGRPERALLLEQVATSARCPRAARLASEWLDATEATPSIRDVADLVALVQLGARDGLPGILIAMAPSDGVLRFLQALAEHLPRLPLAMAVDAPALDRFLAKPGAARTRAMVREGLVHLGRTAGPPFDGEPFEAVSSPSIDDMRRQVVELCRGAATNPELADRARSLAERLLFTALQAHPTTRGRFELNATMPFRFGPRAIEIDLLSLRDRVAIEVDGYHHFVDADAYRRDRRKDVLMQQHGLLVLRFLAQDVGAALERIVDSIADILRQLPSPETSA